MTDAVQIHLFYPLLFFTLIFLSVLFTVMFAKNKDNNLFGNIFNRHVDEHIDTTGKMKDMHDATAKINFTVAHEQEIHNLEVLVNEINQKVTFLMDRFNELQNRHN